MTSKVVITLKNPGFLAGVQNIEFELDGKHIESMHFGDRKEFEIAAGDHAARLILHAIANRSSKELKFSLAEGQMVAIEGKYSRLWGNMGIGLVSS